MNISVVATPRAVCMVMQATPRDRLQGSGIEGRNDWLRSDDMRRSGGAGGSVA